MQATQFVETRDQAATHVKSLATGGGNASPPVGNNYNNYEIRERVAACPAKTRLPVRVASAFPGRIRLQASGGHCRDDRLRALAARLALLPTVQKTEVVCNANSVIVSYAAQARELAAVLRDIEAITSAPRPIPAPFEVRSPVCSPPCAPPPASDVRALIRPIVKRLPAYLRLGWALSREPAIPWRHKTLLYLFPLYYISPVNLLVQSVPVLGLVDEAALFLLGARQALAHCPCLVQERHFARLDLAPRQLEEDIKTVLEVVRRVVSKLLRLGTAGRSLDVAG